VTGDDGRLEQRDRPFPEQALRMTTATSVIASSGDWRRTWRRSNAGITRITSPRKVAM
jgi:hypothetical protein